MSYDEKHLMEGITRKKKMMFIYITTLIAKKKYLLKI